MSGQPAGPTIRRATPADAAGCLDAYAPHVRETTVTFEDEAPTVREAGRLERIGFKDGRWLDVAWLVTDLGPDPAAPPQGLDPAAPPR